MNDTKYKALKNLRFFVETISLLGVVALIVTFAVTAEAAQTPISADASGLVGRLGIRRVLFLLFIIGGAVTGALFIVSRFPRLHKYPVEINAGNVEVQYHILKLALCAAQLVTIFATCFLMISVVNRSIALYSAEFAGVIVTSAILYAVILLAYLLAARRFR
ncbi:MAG: hypothetical protein ACOYJB_04865 [Christensenellaceae bacterium]|jgi:hypothetical protein